MLTPQAVYIFCFLCSSSEFNNYIISKHYLKCFSKLRINRGGLLTLSIAHKLSIRLQSPRLKSFGKAIMESLAA